MDVQRSKQSARPYGMLRREVWSTYIKYQSFGGNVCLLSERWQQTFVKNVSNTTKLQNHATEEDSFRNWIMKLFDNGFT